MDFIIIHIMAIMSIIFALNYRYAAKKCDFPTQNSCSMNGLNLRTDNTREDTTQGMLIIKNSIFSTMPVSMPLYIDSFFMIRLFSIGSRHAV